MKKELYIIALDIRSAYNIGALLRTADGLGISKVYLTGYTCVPYCEENDPYPTKAQKMIAKTALGAEKNVSWKKISRIENLIEKLKKEKVSLVALEKTDQSIDIKKLEPEFPLAIVIGNEIRGVEEEVLKKCNQVVHIPMKGKKSSFNVSIASAIALYEILNK